MVKRLLVLFSSLAVFGCAGKVYNLSDIDESSRYELIVKDERSDMSREGGKRKLFEALYFHGDDKFTPPRVELFKSAVSSAFENKPENIVLKNFDVVDSYAKRAGLGASAGIAATSYVGAIISESAYGGNSDYIVTYIRANVDGSIIEGKSTVPYQTSISSMNVFNDPAYETAVRIAIQNALNMWKGNAKEVQ